MATRMLQRRGTAAEWAAANPILGDGEVGFTTDTRVVKLGNGVTAWNTLPADFITRTIVDAVGDLIVGSAADSVVRLAKGTTGQRLTVQSDGTLAWENVYNLIDVAGDLIVGSGNDAAARLPVGTPGQQLKVSAGGAVVWEAPSATDLSSRVAKSGDIMSGRLQVTDLGVAGGTTLNVRVGDTATKASVDAASIFDTGNRVYSLSNPPPASGTLVSVTNTYVLANGVGIVLANGTFTVTLPTAASSVSRIVDVKNTGTGTISVGTAGGTIDGSVDLKLTQQYSSVTMVSDGTNWFII